MVRRSGYGVGEGGEIGALAPARTGGAGTRAGAVTADLVALRERIAAIAARPPRITEPPPYPPPRAGEGEIEPTPDRQERIRTLSGQFFCQVEPLCAVVLRR